MKNTRLIKILLLLLLSLTTSCKINNQKKLKSDLKDLNSDCPSDGVCSFEILQNKSLQIKEDETGSLYPIINDGESNVLKFEYKRNEIANTQDGQYSELIYVELPQEIKSTNLTDNGLSNVKLLFARLCFCRGQTGYYKVSKGQLEISKIDDEFFNIKVNFKVEEVPQIITSINETFKLNKKRLKN